MKKTSAKRVLACFLSLLLALPVLTPMANQASAAEMEYIPLTVPNNGFEEPMEGEVIPSWTTIPEPSKFGDTHVAKATQARAASGSQSLEMIKYSGGPLEVLSESIPVKEGQTYRLRTKVNVVDKSVRLYVKFKKAGSQKFENAADLLVNNKNSTIGAWNTIDLEAIAPSGAEYAQISFYYGTAGANIIAYIDDVQFHHKKTKEPTLHPPYGTNAIDLGEPVMIALSQAATFGAGPDGALEHYITTTGSPAAFSVVDPVTGKSKFSERVVGATDPIWGIARGSDGNIYFSSTGKLYRYLTAERTIENLGQNPTGNTTMWDVKASSDGKIYGSTSHTSNPGKVFEFDIATKTFKDLGVVKEGEISARGLGVTDQYIFVGTGTNAGLVRIDRQTGDKLELQIPDYTGVKGKTMTEVESFNGFLFVNATDMLHILKENGDTYEYVRSTKFNAKISPPSPDQPHIIYFKSGEELFSYDMEQDVIAEVNINQPLPDTAFKTQAWLTPDSGPFAGKTVLFSMAAFGEVFVYDPASGQFSTHIAELPVIGTQVNVLEHKNGMLFAGGFQRGMSIYDINSQKIAYNFPSFHQPESIDFHGDIAYFGTYTGAKMYRMDLTQPIDFNDYGWGNPGLALDIGDEQNRPFSFTSGDGQIFIGTFPSSGFEGALTVMEERKDASGNTTGVKHETFRNIMPNQSIIGLDYKDGKLYGSTTVYSGSGSVSPAPLKAEAEVFIFNPVSKQIERSVTPKVDGITGEVKIIGDVSVGPDGLIWGILDAFVSTSAGFDAAIFALDPHTLEVVKAKKITQSPYSTSKFRPYFIRWGHDGLMYTTIGRKLIVIDPASLEYRDLLPGKTINLMTLADNGDIYYIDGNKLFKLPIAINVSKPVLEKPSLVPGQTTVVSSTYLLADGSEPNKDTTTVTYVSSNPEILSIEGDQVTAASIGKASIRAIVTSGVTKVTGPALEVTVYGPEPAISEIHDISMDEDTSSSFIPFTLHSHYMPADALTVTAASYNETLIPRTGIELGGSGANRTIRITPASDQYGSTKISLTVTDGTYSAMTFFQVHVHDVAEEQPPTNTPEKAGTIQITDSSKPVDSAALKQALSSQGHVEIIAKTSALLQVLALSDAKENAKLSFVTVNGSYVLEPSKLPYEQWAKQLGVPAAKLTVRLVVEPAAPDVQQSVQQASSQTNTELLSEIHEFQMEIQSENGSSLQAADLGSLYIERSITLPKPAEANAFVAVYDPLTKSLRFVPSKVSGKEAKFWRTGNSAYVVVKAEQSFNDVSDHWGKASIDRMAGRLIVNGTSANAFEPERHITRAEFAAMLNRSLGLLPNAEHALTFGDINANAWYSGEIGYAAKAGLINGYEDGTFQPNRSVSRSEAAAMAIRALTFAGIKTTLSAGEMRQALHPFKDASDTAWAQEELALAVHSGLLQGQTDDQLKPSSLIKRAEAAALLERLLRKAQFMN